MTEYKGTAWERVCDAAVAEQAKTGRNYVGRDEGLAFYCDARGDVGSVPVGRVRRDPTAWRRASRES